MKKKKYPILTSFETRQIILINTNYRLLYEKTANFALCGDMACSLSVMVFPAFQNVRQVHMARLHFSELKSKLLHG